MPTPYGMESVWQISKVSILTCRRNEDRSELSELPRIYYVQLFALIIYLVLVKLSRVLVFGLYLYLFSLCHLYGE